MNPTAGQSYPKSLDTPAKRALFDNLNQDEPLALAVHGAVRASRQDDWRSNSVKIRKVKLAIKAELGGDDALAEQVLQLVMNQHEY